MSFLWVSIAFITVVAVIIVAWPIIRNRNNLSHKSRIEYDIALYKDQLIEVDNDLTEGLLTHTQANAVRTEIQRKLIKTAEREQIVDSLTSFLPNSYKTVITIVGISLFIPIGSVSLYEALGTPTLKNYAYADRDLDAEDGDLETQQANRDMDALLDELTKKLEKDPDNVKGWQLLGRSLIARGRINESLSAYERALSFQPDNSTLITDHAEAKILINNGMVDDKTYQSLVKGLGIEPANPKTRYYVGLYKLQNNNFSGAIQDWVDVTAISRSDAPWMPMVQSKIAQIVEQSGMDRASFSPSSKALEIASTLDLSPIPGPSAQDIEDARQMTKEDRAGMINSMVSRLAEKLKANPADTKGWVRLGRSYRTLGRLDESVQAYRNAYDQDPDNADIALAYGEILVIAEQGYVNAIARQVFEKVLLKDAKNVMARFYFGLALTETEAEIPRALEIMEALLIELPEGSPWRASLVTQIKRAKDALKKAVL